MKLSGRGFAALLVLPVLVIACATYVPAQINVDSHSPLTVASAPASISYADYSDLGRDYALLKGIELKAKSVRFSGSEEVRVLGTQQEFQKFDVVAPVTVQSSCNAVSGAYATAIARYSLAVAPDTKDLARQELLRQINACWSAKSPDESRDYKHLPAEKYLWMDSGRHVLYSQPEDDVILGLDRRPRSELSRQNRPFGRLGTEFPKIGAS